MTGGLSLIAESEGWQLWEDSAGERHITDPYGDIIGNLDGLLYVIEQLEVRKP
ncbi:hypothetical protein SEA_CULVER_158 [Gordonia phage Culver]|nr:hypothetical protein SEA_WILLIAMBOONE_160 [Gordonia phage WilliamBoone]WNM66425.1 hypothetical protein SEA_CULVER_158 [Gordonia phage Culver]